jgi:predicted nuclease with TOPRIM domain
MGPELETRLTNLESNYSRMAEGLKRTADSTDRLHTKMDTLSRFLTGKMDDSTGKHIPGYFARLDDVEDAQRRCLNRQKNSLKSIFMTAKDVVISIATVYIIYKLGIK